MRKLTFTLIVCLLAAPLLLAAPRMPRVGQKRVEGPALAFDGGNVVASEATPGATVHFASLTLGGKDFVTIAEKPMGSAVADGAGVARFTPETPLGERSVWIAVDGSTGGFTVASPSTLLREIDFPGAGVHRGNGSLLRKIAVESRSVDIFLIRPGQGIWTAYLRDGEDNDDDNTINGATHADLAALKGHAGAAAPQAVQHGDVLFVVDRFTLEFFAGAHGK